MNSLQKLYGDINRFNKLKGQTKNVSLIDMLCAPFNIRTSAVFLYRLSCVAREMRLPFVPKLISILNFVVNGIEISSFADIGEGLFLPHPNGVVIGAKSIGRNVTIYQGVTIGAKILDFDNKLPLRPIVYDDVIISSGAKILGPVFIQSGTVIAANSVVLQSTLANSLYAGMPANFIKKL